MAKAVRSQRAATSMDSDSLTLFVSPLGPCSCCAGSLALHQLGQFDACFLLELCLSGEPVGLLIRIVAALEQRNQSSFFWVVPLLVFIEGEYSARNPYSKIHPPGQMSR